METEAPEFSHNTRTFISVDCHTQCMTATLRINKTTILSNLYVLSVDQVVVQQAKRSRQMTGSRCPSRSNLNELAKTVKPRVYVLLAPVADYVTDYIISDVK